MEEKAEYILSIETMHTDHNIEYTIDEDELTYIVNQIKYNVPFIIVMDDNIVSYSPSQCISISIYPISDKDDKE